MSNDTNGNEPKIKKPARIKRRDRTYQCYECDIDIVTGEDNMRIIGHRFDKVTGGWPNSAVCANCDTGQTL